MLPPCGHFLELQLDHSCMTAAVRKRPTAGAGEIHSKHSRLSGSQFPKAKLSSHSLRKKRKHKPKPPPPNKMLSIPNCCRNANRKDDGKSNPTTHNGQRHKFATINMGWSLGDKELPLALGGNIHWQQPVSWSISECLKKINQVLS